ncbi:MarR family winged helix-turn-helix transcriptional regulator [Pseudonocardia zijingensis]|uniref:MarR family winged helix-turn-helix transcriptional regulator n=1 Tax=Pseudonocardia zijingensis TaxID=153376 RepID=UPI0031DC8638
MDGRPVFEVGPLSSAIFRLARLHKSIAARLLRESGLHPGQELVLMTLWRDGPQRQVDLVRTLDSDAPTMARSIARLEKAGLVRRSPSPSDGRAVIVEATEASLPLREKVEQAWATLERLTVDGLSPQRTSEALALLTELEAGLQAAAEQAHLDGH